MKKKLKQNKFKQLLLSRMHKIIKLLKKKRAVLILMLKKQQKKLKLKLY